ncbi:MAG: transcription elongation factor GreA [Acidobacteria bacterium]|nr:MAG: transcription elongation factor GreA [Acidobacteriota bacterium]
MREIRERVERELKQLEHELRYELPKEIERATALGDLRENAEYHAALERQSYVRARIGQLKRRLSQLSTIRMSQIPRDRAGFGSIVDVVDVDSGEERRYELVAAEDGDPANGKLSINSPIGRALAGCSEGDLVTVRAPSGERTLEIVRVVTLHDREGADGDDAP